MTSYVFPFLAVISFSFLHITFEIGHACVPIQNTNAHEMLSDNHKYSTSSFTFISLSIPYLQLIFVSTAVKFLLQFINI